MSRWINADIYVTATLYDDEHEEYRDERMTIAECLDRFTDEGCPTEDKPKKGWIPCSERLPEETGLHICTVNRELFDVRRMKFELLAEGGYRWLLGNGSEVFPSFVVAWMPLPEPWKGAE